MPGSESNLGSVRSSAEWVAYFARNAARQRGVPWERGAGLAGAEVLAIAASLRSWQLGETSDGSHLLAAAKHYASSIGDTHFVDAVRLFIAEEQLHGANLGRFLDLACIPRAEADWGDSLFRALRYAWPSMEVWATPVVMVETHALVYYNALRCATRSEVLRRICEQILSDEVPHIQFHCETLAILHRHRPRWLRWVTMRLQRAMFTVVTLAVWVGHRRALLAGGYDFPRFWRTAWGKIRHAWRRMSPDAYLWTEPNTAPSAPKMVRLNIPVWR